MDKGRSGLVKPINTSREHRDKTSKAPTKEEDHIAIPTVEAAVENVPKKAKPYKSGGTGTSSSPKPSKVRYKIRLAIQWLLAEYEDEHKKGQKESGSTEVEQAKPEDQEIVKFRFSAQVSYTRAEIERLCTEANSQDGDFDDLSEVERSMLRRKVKGYLSQAGVELSASIQDYIESQLKRNTELREAVLKIPVIGEQIPKVKKQKFVNGRPIFSSSHRGFSRQTTVSVPNAEKKGSHKKKTLH